MTMTVNYLCYVWKKNRYHDFEKTICVNSLQKAQIEALPRPLCQEEEKSLISTLLYPFVFLCRVQAANRKPPGK